jgi:hypothetical protein
MGSLKNSGKPQLFYRPYDPDLAVRLSQATVVLAAGLTMAPERMQLVQTRIFLLFPADTATFTLCKFGSQRLLFLLWAWLTLFPVTGFLPHISHILAILKLLYFFFERGTYTMSICIWQVFCPGNKLLLWGTYGILS